MQQTTDIYIYIYICIYIYIHNPAPFQFKNAQVLTDELNAKWRTTSQPMTTAQLLTQATLSGPSDVVCVSQRLRRLETTKLMSVFSCGKNSNCNKFTVLGVVLISLCYTCPK
jgi:hypothetical protein